jgi:vanillate O-demethylase ferredoxin subunit
MSDIALIVQAVKRETPLVKSLVLAPADQPLPGYGAGAHVRVRLPDGSDRPYSLVDLPQVRAAGHYALGVRLEEQSRGGSAYMHSLNVGDRIQVSAPANSFPLVDDARAPLLIAGGVGITPILSMATALSAAGRDYRLHFAGRSAEHLPFVEALRAIAGDRLVCHRDDDPASALDIGGLLDRHEPGAPVYVCGPAGMIAAVRAEALARGLPDDSLRSELFAAAPPSGGERPFEVELASDGRVFTIPPGRSIIDVLESAGIDLMYDCRRGDCGICQCAVLSGIPEHRDVILTAAERASNRLMQICVSRAVSQRLVLDL